MGALRFVGSRLLPLALDVSCNLFLLVKWQFIFPLDEGIVNYCVGVLGVFSNDEAFVPCSLASYCSSSILYSAKFCSTTSSSP